MQRGEGRPAEEVFIELEKELPRPGQVMTYRVILQPRAERDIIQAVRYIRDASRTPATALRWLWRPRAKIDTLRTNPGRCPIDPDSAAYGREVRVLLFGKRSGV